MSASLFDPKYPRHCNYSVFWSVSSDLEVWIATTPREPKDSPSLLLGPALIGWIVHIYKIRLPGQNRWAAIRFLVRRHRWRIMPTFLLLVAGPSALFGYLYPQFGLSWRTFLPTLIYVVSFLHGRFATSYLPKDTSWVLWPSFTVYYVSPRICLATYPALSASRS